VVLLEDHEVHPGLPQAMTRHQPGQTGADDGHGEGYVRRDVVLVPGRCPTILTSMRQLLFQQGQVGDHIAATDSELHDAEHVLVGRHRPRTAPSVTEADQRFEREFPDGRRLLVGQPGPRQVDQQSVGPELGAEQGHVPRGVGQRGQKRGKHGVGQNGP
jgi:hypothetical protein